jgi:hypothetical protein
MFPIDVLRFSEFGTMRNHLSHHILKNQSVPIVSYGYTNSIGCNIFNYKEALQDINIEKYLKNPLTCDYSHSPFQYNPSGHGITGDLNIIQHESFVCGITGSVVIYA